jgi:Uma2 family endonuclease
MTAARKSRRDDEAEPVWQMATLFPGQGEWSEEEYLALETNRLIEYDDGHLDFPPMPTTTHQKIMFLLCRLLAAFAEGRDAGTVLPAGTRVRLWARKYREPDVVFMLADNAGRVREKYWDGADLVMEIVSGGAEDRERDLKTKRADYAKARIPEYWIVDPKEHIVTVLRLKGRAYVEHGVYGKGGTAESALLKGFAVAVDRVFAGK